MCSYLSSYVKILLELLDKCLLANEQAELSSSRARNDECAHRKVRAARGGRSPPTSTSMPAMSLPPYWPLASPAFPRRRPSYRWWREFASACWLSDFGSGLCFVKLPAPMEKSTAWRRNPLRSRSTSPARRAPPGPSTECPLRLIGVLARCTDLRLSERRGREPRRTALIRAVPLADHDNN